MQLSFQGGHEESQPRGSCANSIIAGILISILLNQPAYAYIDPGSTSLILQAVIGAIAAGVFTLKVYWGKVVERFRVGLKRLRDKKERHKG